MAQKEEAQEVKKLENNILILENIRQGHSVERFKFTAQEIQALDYAVKFLKTSLEETNSA